MSDRHYMSKCSTNYIYIQHGSRFLLLHLLWRQYFQLLSSGYKKILWILPVKLVDMLCLGSLGPLIDSLYIGYLMEHISPLYFIYINVLECGLCLGVILLIIFQIRKLRRKIRPGTADELHSVTHI